MHEPIALYTADISKYSYPKNVPKKPKNMSNFATNFFDPKN